MCVHPKRGAEVLLVGWKAPKEGNWVRLKKTHPASMSNSFTREVLIAYARGKKGRKVREKVRDILFGNEPTGSSRNHPCCIIDVMEPEGKDVTLRAEETEPTVVLLLGRKVQKQMARTQFSARHVVHLAFPSPRNDKSNISVLQRSPVLRKLLLPYVRRV